MTLLRRITTQYKRWRARQDRLTELRHELRSVGYHVTAIGPNDNLARHHTRLCDEIDSLQKKRWYK